jgi:hypothetical protein
MTFSRRRGCQHRRLRDASKGIYSRILCETRAGTIPKHRPEQLTKGPDVIRQASWHRLRALLPSGTNRVDRKYQRPFGPSPCGARLLWSPPAPPPTRRPCTGITPIHILVTNSTQLFSDCLPICETQSVLQHQLSLLASRAAVSGAYRACFGIPPSPALTAWRDVSILACVGRLSMAETARLTWEFPVP